MPSPAQPAKPGAATAAPAPPKRQKATNKLTPAKPATKPAARKPPAPKPETKPAARPAPVRVPAAMPRIAPDPEPAGLGLRCPSCGCRHLPVLYTRHNGNRTIRVRECRFCGRRIRTREELVVVRSPAPPRAPARDDD